MLTLILTILISLGFIGSVDDFNNLSTQEQHSLTEIIIEDFREN